MLSKLLLLIVVAAAALVSPGTCETLQDIYPTPSDITDHIQNPELHPDPYEHLFANGFCEEYCNEILTCEESLVDLCVELCNGFEPQPVLDLYKNGADMMKILQTNDITQRLQCCDDTNCLHSSYSCSRSNEMWRCESDTQDDYE